jgi:hypothetical protein
LSEVFCSFQRSLVKGGIAVDLDTGVNQDIINEARNLGYELGISDVNNTLRRALRLLKIVVDYENSKRQLKIESFAMANVSEIEEEVANALRLMLAIKANMPVNRIELARPRAFGNITINNVPGVTATPSGSSSFGSNTGPFQSTS